MDKTSFELSPASALKRHWGVALAAFASAVGASIVYLAMTPSTYETKARLLVVEQEASVSNLGQALTDSNTKTPSKTADPIATQAELVKSQAVLDRALENFSQTSFISVEQLPSTQKLSKAVKVRIVPATNILKLSYTDGDRDIATGLLNAIAEAAVAENIETIRLEATAVREFLESRIPEQQQRLQEAEDAERNYRQANEIVSLEVQTQTWVNSLAALEQEERALLAQLQEASTRNDLLEGVTGVKSPRAAYNAVRIGQDEELQALKKELSELEVTILDRQSVLTNRHPEMLALLDKRAQLQQLYARTLGGTANRKAGPRGDIASDPVSQDLMTRYTIGEIETQALASRLDIVQGEVYSLRNRIAQLPAQRQPLAHLVRQREEAEATLELLKGKLEEAQIAEAQLIGNLRIVGRAEVPIEAIAPQPPVFLLLGMAAGSVAAIAIVLFLEIIDVRLRDGVEAENLLGLPLLGALPELPPDLARVSDLEDFLNAPMEVEPYRRLLKTIDSKGFRRGSSSHESPNGRSSGAVLQVPISEKPRIIAISSVMPTEGKSAVVLHLSAVAAMFGRRTLIVDADWQSPLQHYFFSQPLYPGLMESLKNPASFRNSVRSTQIENLDLLPYGQRSSRPSAPSESSAMKTLLAHASAHYDLVVIDVATMSLCADVTTLSQWTDGAIVVVRPNFTAKETIRREVSEACKSGAVMLGVAMNETVTIQEKHPPTSWSDRRSASSPTPPQGGWQPVGGHSETL